MLWLIDGYNLMYAMGAISGKDRPGNLSQQAPGLSEQAGRCSRGPAGPGDHRRLRRQFAPSDFPLESEYRGLSLIFALGDESADARIEHLIAHHPSPKSLTVVSTDHRIRRARPGAGPRDHRRPVPGPGRAGSGTEKQGEYRRNQAPFARAPDRDLPLSTMKQHTGSRIW